MSAFIKVLLKSNELTLAGALRLLAVFAFGLEAAELLAAAVDFFGAIFGNAEATADDVATPAAFSYFECVKGTFRGGSAGGGVKSEASSVRSAAPITACSAFVAFERVIGTLREMAGVEVGRGSGPKRTSTVEGVDLD